MRLILLCLTVLFSLRYSCAVKDYPFRNVSLPWNTRVKDLTKRLSLSEIVSQMQRQTTSYDAPTAGIPRLGIPPYNWNTECLRGAVEAGPATSFPQAIGLAASFDTQIIYNVALATGIEQRAKFNNASKHHIYTRHIGVSCFSPMINIMRHPLWGRNQESYGEDPHLTSKLSENFVKGLRGTNNRYILASATCKHFAAHDGPENFPVSRLSFDANVTNRDLYLTYLPQFTACIRAGALGVMCSYNSLNGVPNCANKWLLTDYLRTTLNFTGYVVSDEGALEFMVDFHKAFSNFLDAAVAAVHSGVNLEDVPNTQITVYSSLLQAVRTGRVKETTLRSLVEPLFYTRFRLGLFDPDDMNPYSKLNATKIIQNDDHRILSLQSAVKSFVLLKNNGLLPLRSRVQKLAVLGPFATNMSALYGDYSADRMPPYETSVLKGLSMLSVSAVSDPFCLDGPKCTRYDQSKLSAIINSSDIVVVTLGLGIDLESENIDRFNLSLPDGQNLLLKEVLNKAKKNVLVLIFSGSPVKIDLAVKSSVVSGILWCGYPAQTVGDALFRSLTGSDPWTIPAGRLPFTWYFDSKDLQNITDYTMGNLTYRYYTGRPQFPFGFGKSYSKFHYRRVSVAATLHYKQSVNLTVDVINLGPYPADEVIQIYFGWPSDISTMPKHQLTAFRRTHLEVNRLTSVEFSIASEESWIWSKNTKVPFFGNLRIYVGGQQPNQIVKLDSNIIMKTIKLCN